MQNHQILHGKTVTWKASFCTLVLRVTQLLKGEVVSSLRSAGDHLMEIRLPHRVIGQSHGSVWVFLRENLLIPSYAIWSFKAKIESLKSILKGPKTETMTLKIGCRDVSKRRLKSRELQACNLSRASSVILPHIMYVATVFFCKKNRLLPFRWKRTIRVFLVYCCRDIGVDHGDLDTHTWPEIWISIPT